METDLCYLVCYKMPAVPWAEAHLRPFAVVSELELAKRLIVNDSATYFQVTREVADQAYNSKVFVPST